MFHFKSKLFQKFVFRKKSDYVESLELILGFRPGNIELYRLALRHRSVTNNSAGDVASNERLEFLGDAVLTAVISEYLFTNYPQKMEGGLTKMRTKLVNGSFLNSLALRLRIDALLEAGIGEKENPKSIYGDALEALIGAVYIDRGHRAAKQFILFQLLQIEDRKDELMNVEIDHKSRLVEWAQKEKVEAQFQVTENLSGEIRYHAKLLIGGKAISSGQGLTKKEAEQNASRAFFDRRVDE